MNKPIKIIDKKLGYLKIFSLENIKEIKKKEVSINGTILMPDSKTTLNNLFEKEVEYLGIHDGYMQFKVGENNDLFGKEIWCNEFKKISEQRIVTCYQEGTARDYVFKERKWK